MKILITDDHALFREGLRYVLRQLEEGVIILEAGDCHEAVRLVSEHQDLDLILLDLVMEGTRGLDALKILRDRVPSVPIVIVSAVEERDIVRQALDRGAQGYIPKSSTGAVMINALRLILSGDIYLPPLLLDTLARQRQPVVSNNPTPAAYAASRHEGHGLTLRQLEVLSLVCQGLSNKHICRVLGLSQGTVKIHVTAILKALNVSNRTQAVLAAKRLGLTDGVHG